MAMITYAIMEYYQKKYESTNQKSASGLINNRCELWRLKFFSMLVILYIIHGATKAICIPNHVAQ